MNLRGLTVTFDTSKIPSFSTTDGILEYEDVGNPLGGPYILCDKNGAIVIIDGADGSYGAQVIYNASDWEYSSFTFLDSEDRIVKSNSLKDGLSSDSSWTFKDTSIEYQNIFDQVEVGSEHVHLNLNTNDDPEFGTDITVDTPNGKERIAYKGKIITDLPVEITSEASWNNASLYTSGDCEITLTDAIPVGGKFDLTKYAEGIVTVKTAEGLTLNREHPFIIIPDIDQAIAIVRVSDTDFSVIGIYEYQQETL
ncbi:hypothetical protein D0T49_12440 [Paludibacter sp. 221]|uniref:hypothetical protein n=1 Tax=Paludibacter sp. 221 TaxID=2302939 RepID=UPI0013CFF825|nr:hypothetical protein [Paludibacter sp. 221]NDV47855.1 hypothetical protein [Paludibacter sp. 221]